MFRCQRGDEAFILRGSRQHHDQCGLRRGAELKRYNKRITMLPEIILDKEGRKYVQPFNICTSFSEVQHSQFISI